MHCVVIDAGPGLRERLMENLKRAHIIFYGKFLIIRTLMGHMQNVVDGRMLPKHCLFCQEEKRRVKEERRFVGGTAEVENFVFTDFFTDFPEI